MKKIGIEVEFFGLNLTNKLVNMRENGIPCDEYPLLAEARGQASIDVFQAVASVRGEIDRMTVLMKEKAIIPLFADWKKRDTDLEEEILRAGYHKQIAYQNLYGKSPSKKNKNFYAAGLHVSITDATVFDYKVDDKKRTPAKYEVNRNFDWPLIFNRITKEFIADIRNANRVEGFYEVKPDARVEYRSLPATIIHSPNFAERLNRCIFPK